MHKNNLNSGMIWNLITFSKVGIYYVITSTQKVTIPRFINLEKNPVFCIFLIFLINNVNIKT